MNKIISLSIFVFLFGRRCVNVGVVASSSPTTTTKSTITTNPIESPELSSSLSETPTKTATESTLTKKSIGTPESLKLSPRIVSLNIMVAGLAGMGKTTMCRALLDSWWEEIEEGRESIAGMKKKTATTMKRRFLSSTTTTTKIDSSSTTKKYPPITVSTTDISPSAPFEYYDEEANTILRVRIIDTPGFGNRVNHRNSVKPITDYISCCRHRRFRREQSPSNVASTYDDCYLEEENYNGKNNNSKKNNNSSNDNNYNSMLVHVCLYFISPGRFLAIDRHFLKHVQDEVTIVPIIAKVIFLYLGFILSIS
jgi:septin family protein